MRWRLAVIVVFLVGVVAACSTDKEQQAEAESPTEQATEAQTEEQEQAKQEAEEKAEAAVGATSEVLTKERQAELTPDKVLEELKAGNKRFVDGKMMKRDLTSQVSATSGGQYPSAVVLGCVDSRVPPEIVFDQGIGDIFSARVAGNIINDELLGSIEFATKVAGSKLVVVMGHTSCGAVMGSCDNVELGHVTSLVKEIRPSVEAVTPEGESCSSDNKKLVDKIADHNVERTIGEIRKKSEVLTELEEAGDVKIVGAMYDVSSGKVTFK